MLRAPAVPISLMLASVVTAGCGGGLPASDAARRAATGPIVVVANQDHAVATIVDVDEWRLVAHLEVKMDPHEGAAASNGSTVALASPSTWLGDAQTIALIDVRSSSLVRSIDIGPYRWPHGLAFLDDRTLAVSSRAHGGIAIVDIESGRVTASARAAGSQPYLLQVAKGTNRAYVSSPQTNAIAEYDLATRTFTRNFDVPDQPAGFAVSPDGRTLWASTGAHDQGGTIMVIDVDSGTTRARLPVRGHARRLAFTADGARIVATDVQDDAVLVFEAGELRETGRIPLGSGTGPSGVVCAPGRGRCYVSTIGSGELIELDATGLQAVRRLKVGTGADGVVYVPQIPFS